MAIGAALKGVLNVGKAFADDALKGGKSLAKGAAHGVEVMGRAKNGNANIFQKVKGGAWGAAKAARQMDPAQQKALLATGGIVAAHDIGRKTS
jgi:hypothetical protein